MAHIVRQEITGQWNMQIKESPGYKIEKEGSEINGKFTGNKKMFEIFNNKEYLRWIAHYEKGLLEGKFQYFNFAGDVVLDANFKKDFLDGYLLLYDLNYSGCKELERNFKNGVAYGQQIKYETCRISKIFNYLENNIVTASLYYEYSDELQYEESYVLKNDFDWVPHGIVKTYWREEKLKSELYYLNGLLEGRYLEYHQNGSPAVVENYKKGKKDGKCQYFDREGNLMRQTYYVSDIPVGRSELFDTHEKLREVIIYNQKGKMLERYQYDEQGVTQSLKVE